MVVVLSLQVLCLQSPLQRDQDGDSASQMLWHVGGWKTMSLLLPPCYAGCSWVTHVLWVLLPAMDLARAWTTCCCSPSMLFGQRSSRAHVSTSSYAHPATPCGHLRWLQAPVPWLSCGAPALAGSAARLSSLSACRRRSGTGSAAPGTIPVPSILFFLGGVIAEGPWLPSCLPFRNRGGGNCCPAFPSETGKGGRSRLISSTFITKHRNASVLWPQL